MRISRSINKVSGCIRPRFLSTTTTVHDKTVFQTHIENLPITHNLEIKDTKTFDKWPVFRILGPDGKVDAQVQAPKIDDSTLVNMYKTMVRIQALDEVFYNAQRQGRISFYMQSAGEEATHIGSAAALDAKDVILTQYREVGVLLWRGFTLQQAADQCFSNGGDLGKGRQMPVHYGSRAQNFHTVSSPLATQLPQAAGVGYALKLAKEPAVAVCFFGEGAASEGDFHAALNFSSTLEVPVIFFCRNNGYAISTPSTEQFRGDGISSRAAGYGMHCIRVDGNDVFAVYEATKAARALALEKNRPVLIEAMTYRKGHHSTSDDSTRYRSASEIEFWHDNFDPLARFRLYLESKQLWNEELETATRSQEKAEVMKVLQVAEKKGPPELDSLFDDVYATLPPNLVKQRLELQEHMKKHQDHYSGNQNSH